MAQSRRFRRLRMYLDFGTADQGVKNAVFHRHPFPHRTVGNAFGNNNLILDPPGLRIDQLARFIIRHV